MLRVLVNIKYMYYGGYLPVCEEYQLNLTETRVKTNYQVQVS